MPKTVLIADDNGDIRQLLKVALLATYDVLEAPDGQAACDMLAADPANFDALILDLAMPRMSGFDVLERIRADPATAQLPVLVLTARTDRDSKVDAFVGGGHVFMTKPFDLDRLMTRLAELLRRSPAARQASRLNDLINLED